MKNLKDFFKLTISSTKSLVNQVKIKNLMTDFKADDLGHEANYMTNDLGYGWIHYALVRMIKPKKIVCVGSRYGYIPAILAQGCKDNDLGHVYFIDAGYGKRDKKSWTGVGYWKTKRGQNCFKKFNVDKNISLFVKTSQEFAKEYQDLAFDYVYIDGDHSYQGVKLDYDLFWPRINQKGFISFHDISIKDKRPEGLYGVNKLWKELKKKHSNHLEFPNSHSGLGLIQKL